MWVHFNYTLYKTVHFTWLHFNELRRHCCWISWLADQMIKQLEMCDVNGTDRYRLNYTWGIPERTNLILSDNSSTVDRSKAVFLLQSLFSLFVLFSGVGVLFCEFVSYDSNRQGTPVFWNDCVPWLWHFWESPCLYYSWLSLSRPRLSQITAYLKVKIWFLPKHEKLTTGRKILWKRGEIAPLYHNIFNISLTSGVKLHIHLLNVVVRIIFSSILQIWHVEVRISRSISESPLEFEITRVDCILKLLTVYYREGEGAITIQPHSLSLGKFKWKLIMGILLSNFSTHLSFIKR